MSNNIEVSIIIPGRNEKKFINKCLNSLIANDYPKEKLEILFIDGMSKDKTRDIVLDFSKINQSIKLIENPKKITPVALNIGIKESKGVFILRADVHSTYNKNYISKCVEYLKKTDADCVGGTLNTKTGSNSYTAKTISLVLSSIFGVGNSFRTIKKEAYVDTVPFGAYKKEVFKKVGLFNENLVRNQDIELNNRIRRAGGKIFLTPKIKSTYFAPPTLIKLIQKQFKNGLWNIYTEKFAPGSLSWRHFIPFYFIIGITWSLILSNFFLFGKILLLLTLGVYSITDLFFSFNISLRNNWKYLCALPCIFFILHFSYGIGSLCGAIIVLFNKMPRMRQSS